MIQLIHTGGVDGLTPNRQKKLARRSVEAMSSARNCPLLGKSFYLDLPNGKNLEFLANSVKQLGGVVESFLSKEVTCVVSSNQEAKQETWAEKQTRTGVRDTQAGSQPSAGLQKGHRRSLQQSTNNVLNSRGKKLLHKAIGSQDNTCGNSILASARSWGVKILHTDEMLSYIRRLSKRCPPGMKRAKLHTSGLQPPKVMRLKPPFLKIEDESRLLRPFLQQFKNFPQMCSLTLRKCSPFEPLQASPGSKNSKRRQSPTEVCPPSVGNTVPPRQKGYCECCKEAFTELDAHLHSQRHKEFALDSSHYTLVDNLISQLCNDFEVFSCSPALRVSPANKDNGETSGVEVEAAKTTTEPPSDKAVGSCTPTPASVGQPFRSQCLVRLLERQGFLRGTERPTEMSSTPLSFTLPSPQPVSELCKQDPVTSVAHSKSITCAEAELCATLQQKKLVAFPARLSHKRKRSSSFCTQGEKRQALSKAPSDERGPSKNPPSWSLQVYSTECPLPHRNGSQAAPGQLRLPASPLHSSVCISPPFPREGLSCHSGEPIAVDVECSKAPVPQLSHAEVSGHCSSAGQDIGRLFSFASAELKSPKAEHVAPKQPDSVVQRCSPCVDISELAQDMFAQQTDLNLGSCLSLLYCPLTSLSAEAKSSSSMSEWDGPLLCAVAGASHLPFEGPIDASLLGTCVDVPDRSYESHLSSVLWQKTGPNMQRGLPVGTASHMQ